MKAMYYERFGTRPEIRDVPEPTPDDDGVVIKVAVSGLCRSDWHGWKGHDPDIHLPHVPGHEFAGRIVAKGRNVRRYRIGERVTVPFVAGCGHCADCLSGNQQVCADQSQPGFTKWGSFAECVAIDYADNNLVHLPDEIDDATAASLGCRFATAFRAIVDQAKTRPGEWVAVHGAGGVGLSAIMIATALGANVIAVDISDEKLAFARECGAVAVVDATKVSDVAEAIREVTGGGAHVSMDALGHTSTCYNSISCLRRRGRHVQVGLMLGDNDNPRIPMSRVIGHELEIYGSHGIQAWRYDAMLAMIATGKVAPQKLIRRHVGLEDAIEPLITMDRSDGVGITVIDF